MLTPLEFSTDLARRTGGLLIEYFHNANTQGKFKSDQSLVTEADLAADRLIAAAIRSQYPNDIILSEELQPALAEATGKVVWIIDPIDGTTNFNFGLPLWGVLITRVVGDFPDLTVMYFPLVDELYSATRGAGAYLNGEPIQVETNGVDNPASFFVCCARTIQNYHIEVPYKARILGSAAYNFCCIARGSAKVAFEATPKIWDIAGGWLLIREAGGVIDTYDDVQPFPLIYGAKYNRINYPTLAAATWELVERTRQQIHPKN
jgi:myo-inositol-1(or 4)-monophosphatase